MREETTVPEMIVRLDNGTQIALAWLTDCSVSVSQYQAGHARDGHGWILTGAGVIPAETVGSFLMAALTHTPPPHNKPEDR